MAYKVTVNKACINRAAAVEEIHTKMLAMGWEYVSGIMDHPALDIPYTDVSIANDTFTKVGHTLVNGDQVCIQTTGTVPTGLSLTTRYFVVGVSGDTFKLSLTYGGTAVNITAQGTGNHSIVEANRIYKSNGENSDQIYHYVQFRYYTSPTQINFIAFYYWDASTLSCLGYGYSFSEITTNETGFYLWIHGNKDKVHLMTKVVSTYYRGFFGFTKPFFPLKTTLSENASTGSSVVLTVASSTGFEVGYYYQIVGANGEGRDKLQVTAVGTGTITVASLPRNYASGAFIGINPCPYGNTNQNGAYYLYVNPMNVVGTENTASSSYGATYNTTLDLGAANPDYRTQKYILFPIAIYPTENISTESISSYTDDYILDCSILNMFIEDTFAVGRLDSGTSSGSNSSSTLNDTSKSWTTDAYQNKVCIITFGLGSGMIKKISSNTATTLSFSGEYVFETIPDSTSQYIICDEGYRFVSSGTSAGTTFGAAVREGI